MRAWAPRVDLVSPADILRFEERHIADSLRALPLIDALGDGPVADVGSGAGLPGVPLAIARPQRLWRLIEPRARRAAFLDEVVRALDLNCEVIVATAEEAAAQPGLGRGHRAALGRALAPPPRAFALLGPLVAPGGLAIVYLGRHAKIPPDAELAGPGLAIVREMGS